MTLTKTIEVYSPDCKNVGEGLFLSKVNGDIQSYEFRITLPNHGAYLTNEALHSTIHLFTVFQRDFPMCDDVIHFSALPCRTGFCLLVRDIPSCEVLSLMQNFMKFITQYSGKIPFRNAHECANYIEHSLDGAKIIAALGSKILENYTTDMMEYSQLN